MTMVLERFIFNFNGRYFVKDDKKWIYNMDSLLSQVDASSDGELEELGYDVEAYYRLCLESRIR